MVRHPESALEYGIQFLKDCFRGVPDDVTKTVHICCGFPFYLVSSCVLSFNLTDNYDYHYQWWHQRRTREATTPFEAS